MPLVRRLCYAILGFLLLALPAHATWSIVIVDLATGEVAVGIATCLSGFDLRPSTVVVVPGYGVATAQSFVGPLQLRELIRTGFLNGTSAAQILQMLAAADPGHQTRQYGIAGVFHGQVTFTGTGAGAWAGGLTGISGNLAYAIQGNVLTGQPVIQAAELAIQTTAGTIADKLMAAMDAARSMGGDGRCSCLTGGPTACGSPPPSFTKSAHCALMIVSRPSDVDVPCSGAGGCGGGEYWLDLNIANQQPNDPDPVLQLLPLYQTWRANQVGRPDHFQSSVTMSGTTLRSNGIDTLTGTVWLRDAQGLALGNSLPVTVGLSSRSTVGGVTFGPAVPQPNGSYEFTMQGNLQAGTAIVDVAVHDAFGRVGVAPQPVVTVTDAFGPCGAGAIANGSGGVIDALRIGGSGGTNRVVEIGYGQPFVLTLDPPVGAPSTLPVGVFALWAHLGMPQPTSALPLGPGAGSLCFTPYPLAAAAPTLLVADTFGLGGFLAATPAPWVLGFPGIPALLDVTMQAAMIVDLQGTVAATNALLLRTTPLAPPVISSITPRSALAGQTVTITGTNFKNGIVLAVGGQPTPITGSSPTSLTFTMPPGQGCDTPLGLTNLGTSTTHAVMNGTPTITNMPFASGPAAGGATFVLTGQYLLGTTVTFNGVPMTISTQSMTTLVGLTPPGTPGPAAVVVSNVLGCQDTRTYTYQ
ncbi:MAG: DUF1028 domain-containing protein [Planctomycetota bacterium]